MTRKPMWMCRRWWLWVYPSAAGGWFIWCMGRGYHVARADGRED